MSRFGQHNKAFAHQVSCCELLMISWSILAEKVLRANSLILNIGVKSRWTQQSVQMWSLKTSMEPLILTPNAQVPFTLLTYHLFTHHALLIYYVEEQVRIVGVHLEYFQLFCYIWLSKYINLWTFLKQTQICKNTLWSLLQDQNNTIGDKTYLHS
jgi:hypothetical protein